MRDSKSLKRRLTALLAFAPPLLALLLTGAPVRSQDAAELKVLASSAPAYPRIAEVIRASGKIVVLLVVNADGRVTNAEAVSGHPVLRRAAEEAAARWNFEPAGRGARARMPRLTFDFILEPKCNGEPVFRSPYEVEVRPAFDPYRASDTEDDRPADSANKHCPVHRLRLKEDKVEISYGLTIYKPGFLEAEEKLFPYAKTNVGGGCVIDMEKNPCTGEQVQVSPKFALVLYCPKCRAAQKRWSDAHPWPRG